LLFIFDLDGTLIDSAKDLALSVNAARGYFSLPALDLALIASYVGNGARVLIQRAFPSAPEQTIEKALAFFLEHYREHALDNTELYPGVHGLLDKLHSMEHQIAVLTNKPTAISNEILGGLGIADYFFRIYGGDTLGVKKPDPAGVHRLLKDSGAMPSDTLFVGDSSVDVHTARNAGIRCCGVRWGLQPESLKLNPPDIVINEPHELLAYL
jgi:phosphoglycolate phosphatase